MRIRFLSWLLGSSPTSKKLLAKAMLGAGASISLIIWGLFSLAEVTSRLLALPSTLTLPPALRVLGATMLAAGIGLALWLFRYRSPMTMLVSTYFTFRKMLTRAPVSKLQGRTEPLVVRGPQKYVRNPLYLAAIAMFLGWALITGVTYSFLGVLFVIAWFRLVQIPFEEKELRAIFGEQATRYSAEVPMLVPFSRRRKRRGALKP